MTNPEDQLHHEANADPANGAEASADPTPSADAGEGPFTTLEAPDEDSPFDLAPAAGDPQLEDDVDDLLDMLEAAPDATAVSADRPAPASVPETVAAAPAEPMPANVEEQAAPSPPPSRAPVTRPRHPQSPQASASSVTVALGIFLVLATAIGFAIWFKGRKPRAAPSAQAAPPAASAIVLDPASAIRTPRRSIAVIGFTNLSRRPEFDWVGTALAEMLTIELSGNEQIRTIARDHVSTMRRELGLPRTASYTPEALSRVRIHLNADMLVAGSFVVLQSGEGVTIRLDTRVQDTLTGQTIAAISEVGTETELSALVNHASTALRERLAPRGGPSSPSTALPSNRGAARYYSDGVDHFHRFDARRGRDWLELAVVADPDLAVAHSALASALITLGYDTEAQRAAANARSHSSAYPREERLVFEALDHETRGEWDAAAAVWQRLFDFFSDDLDHGIRLANAQVRSNKAAGTLQTIARMRALPSPLGDDPRIDLAEASARLALGEFQPTLDIASAGIEKSNARGTQFTGGQLRFLQGLAFSSLGQTDRAIESYSAARQIFEQSGNHGAVVRALNATGAIHAGRGNADLARQTWQEALAIARTTGERHSMLASLNGLATSAGELGSLDLSARSLGEALTIAQQGGDAAVIASISNDLAAVEIRRGNLEAADRVLVDALALVRSSGNKAMEAAILDSSGILRLRRGQVQEALKLTNEALDLATKTETEALRPVVLHDLAMVQQARDDLAAARDRHEEVLALLTQPDDRAARAETSTALGQISLLQGAIPDAERLQGQAIEQLDAKRNPGTRISVLTLRLRIAIAKGDARQIESAARALEPALASIQDVITGARARIALALAATAASRPAAIQRLEGLSADLRKQGLVEIDLECRLALGQLMLASGEIERGRTVLTSVQTEASRLGFRLVARQATEASKG